PRSNAQRADADHEAVPAFSAARGVRCCGYGPGGTWLAVGPPGSVAAIQGQQCPGDGPHAGDGGGCAYGVLPAYRAAASASASEGTGGVQQSRASRDGAARPGRHRPTGGDRAAPPTAVNASAAVAGPPAATAGIATLLHSESSSTTPARVLPTQRLLLPKGAFIDCTLETAIDSTLPGMTTCVTATDTFGVDGKVLLLERGTKLVGETRGQVQQGAARVFVLWTEARTPTGVIVPLDSPAADELGRAGLPGTVDRHFWERFGAALFIST